MKKDLSPKKIIIVGAGISGLSTGIYAQKNGFITEIFEKNPNSGGLCQSWTRKGYDIDGCIHWMTGTNPSTTLYSMWHDLNAFDDEDIIRFDDFGSVEYNGEVYRFHTNLNKLTKELIEKFPKDKRRIKRLKKMVDCFYNMPIPMEKPTSCMNIFELMWVGIKMIPFLPRYLYAIHRTQESFAKKFHSPELRYFFSRIVPGQGNLYTTLYAYATVAYGNGGVPRGGSKKMVNRITDEYLKLGGVIHNNSSIKDIIIRKGVAKGVRLIDGREIYADYVVTACDLLEARKLLHKIKLDIHHRKRFFRKREYPLPSCTYISYIADKDVVSKLGVSTTHEFRCEPYQVGHTVETNIKMRNYLYDSNFVKNDKVLITVHIHQTDRDYYHWASLRRKNYNDYLAAKNELASDVAKRIIDKFPTLKDSLETLDVCTPATYHRYVNAYHGAYMTWEFTEKGSMLIHKQRFPHIKNLYIAGQWAIMPGGLPIAMLSGKFAVQKILKKEKHAHSLVRLHNPKFY